MNQKSCGDSADYAAWLAEIKTRVTAARQRGAGCECGMIRLYWQIGRHSGAAGPTGLGQQGHRAAGAFARSLSGDEGTVSSSNVKYMRYFAEHRPRPPIWSAAC